MPLRTWAEWVETVGSTPLKRVLTPFPVPIWRSLMLQAQTLQRDAPIRKLLVNFDKKSETAGNFLRQCLCTREVSDPEVVPLVDCFGEMAECRCWVGGPADLFFFHGEMQCQSNSLALVRPCFRLKRRGSSVYVQNAASGFKCPAAAKQIRKSNSGPARLVGWRPACR